MTQKNRFTPGPWRVFGKMTGKVISENAPGIVEICETGDFRDAELVPFNADRWNADARLIAAAPDMLEALRVARAEIVSLELAHFNEIAGPGDTFDAWLSDNEALPVIDAAIARATGEKP